MTTLSPTIINAVNANQPLFTIDYPLTGVPQYNTVGNSATLLYTSTPTNNDVDASVAVDDTGDIGLNDGLTFNIICQVLARTSVPTFYKLVERDTGTQVGDARPIELPLQVTINSQAETYYNIVVFTLSGNNFAYPDQISNINLTVQAVAGYELPA